MPTPLEYDEVRKLLPYRPPMLLIDRVADWSAREIVVEKTVFADDPLVDAHLIYGPKVMPGVLLIELVGQGAYLHQILRASGAVQGPPRTRFLGRCKGRFVRPAGAGDRILAEITEVGRALNGAVHQGRLTVGNQLIAEVEVISGVVPSLAPNDSIGNAQ